MAKTNTSRRQAQAAKRSNSGLIFGIGVAAAVAVLLIAVLAANNRQAPVSNPAPAATSVAQQPPINPQPVNNPTTAPMVGNNPSLATMAASEECAGNEEYGQTPRSSHPTGKVAATVNGESIPMDYYLAYVQSQDQAYIGQFYINTECAIGRRMLEVLHEDTLEELITNEIGIQQAAKEGIKPDPAKVDAQLAQQKSAIEKQMPWEQFLAQQKTTEADYRKNIEKAYTLLAASEAHAKAVTDETYLNVAHILVGDEAKAAALYQQLQAGADFGTLARQSSTDELTKNNGGLIGAVNPDAIDRLTGDLIRNLKDGEFTKPFQSRQGWEIIKVNGRELKPIPQENVQEQQKSDFRRWVDSVRPNYKVEYFITFQPTVTPDPSRVFPTYTPDPLQGVPRGLTGMGGLPGAQPTP